MDALLATLGDEIQDVDEEVYDLFSQSSSLEDLGMLNSKTAVLDVNIAGRDFEITQSPGLLESQREGGTTGAAVWQSTVRCAEWMETTDNVLFTSAVLNSESTVLELGAGISGILPCILGPKVDKFVCTDQAYTLKALQSNITSNTRATRSSSKSKRSDTNVRVLPLDWETDDASSFLHSNGLSPGPDMIIACDCIYNYALIRPFVQTCADLSKARRVALEAAEMPSVPTLCIVVQQLRQAEVFEQWVTTFHQFFHVWRVPSDQLSVGLQDGSGFAVHIGLLREES
ncbi:Putative lysine methyltransferase [Septoria linicola]|uniref:Lysine methyltransferase n=1 Tax=Septoria linicola TaxID=215465 RepID=A0A9Q9EKN8_9PEZI|nr:Putative lysine methyltransferase [Septoria linicola]